MISNENLLNETLNTIFDKNDLENEKLGDRQVLISGAVNNPGVYEIPESATIADVVELCGGIKDRRTFKGAQFGIPFGGFANLSDYHKVIDFGSHFDENKSMQKSIIILSNENCIVQFSKYYMEFLIAKIEDETFLNYAPVKNEVERIWRVLDRISKGKSNMRDLYLLRHLSKYIKETIGAKYSFIEEVIDEFYEEFEEHIEEHNCYAGECPQLIKFRITKKCIGCTACARVCPVHCIEGKPKEKHVIDIEKCTHCGRCVSACPVNAIAEGDNTQKFLRDLITPGKIVVTQMAPAVRVALGEAFGFDPGVNIEKKINGALRAMGVKYIFDTAWAADLTIMEEASEFQYRLEKFFKEEEVRLPILTSCCPAWVKFIEQSYPDMLDVPSTVKSPMQMMSTIVKDIWAKELGYKRDQVSAVAIMPCVAKKYEAAREEFSRGDNYDTDYVITTRELIRIFKDKGIDLKTIEESDFDNPLGEYSGAGIIFGRTGGVIEAATRTTIEMITGEKIDNIEFNELRGWDGFRSCDLKIGHIELRIGIAHGLEEAKKMLDKIRTGEEFYHAIEIMACKGGCVGGGGQPKAIKKQVTLEMRAEGLNSIDKNSIIRRSHENPNIKAIYDKYLDSPLSRKAHELLHTRYFPKIKGGK